MDVYQSLTSSSSSSLELGDFLVVSLYEMTLSCLCSFHKKVLYRLIIFRKSFLLTIFSKKLNDFSSFSYVVELSCNIFVINAKIMKILTYLKKKNQAVQKSEFDSDTRNMVL